MEMVSKARPLMSDVCPGPRQELKFSARRFPLLDWLIHQTAECPVAEGALQRRTVFLLPLGRQVLMSTCVGRFLGLLRGYRVPGWAT